MLTVPSREHGNVDVLHTESACLKNEIRIRGEGEGREEVIEEMGRMEWDGGYLENTYLI